jgi:aryl-alcohol dehydrogenase-like predicted oxidoreductase
MQQRPLGPGAPEVSAVSFGGMPLSIQGRPDNEAHAIEVIHSVLDAGVTLLDTANVYCLDDDDIGHNERLVAKAVSNWPGDRNAIIIATKGGLTRPQGRWERDARPSRLKAACERSLQALDVECIDLYQLHAPDTEVPFEDSVGALSHLQEEGKIRWIGLSNVSVEEIEIAQQIVDVVTVQNRLSPFFREAVETGIVQHCAEHGIGFLAYSPVGGGRLNKKLPGHPALHPIAREHGISPHATVIAWVLAQGPSIIPIPGARTVEHAMDSLTAAGVELSPTDLEAIDTSEFSTA